MAQKSDLSWVTSRLFWLFDFVHIELLSFCTSFKNNFTTTKKIKQNILIYSTICCTLYIVNVYFVCSISIDSIVISYDYWPFWLSFLSVAHPSRLWSHATYPESDWPMNPDPVINTRSNKLSTYLQTTATAHSTISRLGLKCGNKSTIVAYFQVIHSIGHVNEYPTMHYFGNPRQTQSMIASMILSEYF